MAGQEGDGLYQSERSPHRSLRVWLGLAVALCVGVSACSVAGSAPSATGALSPSVSASASPHPLEIRDVEPLAVVHTGLERNGDQPMFLSQAAANGALWFAAPSGLVRVDPRTNEAEVIDTDFGAYLAVVGDAVWRQAYFLDRVSRYDSASALVDMTLHIPGPLGIVATESDLWVTEHNTGMLDEVDPVTGDVVMQAQVGHAGEAGLAGIQVVDDSLWIGVPADRNLLQVNPVTGTVVATIPLPYNPGERLVYAGGALWMAAGDSDAGAAPPGTLMRFDPATAQVAVVEVPPGPDGGEPMVTEIEGEAWIPSGDLLIQLDRSTGQPKRAVRLGVDGYVGTTVSEMLGGVWISSRISPDLVLVAPADLRQVG